MTKQNEIEADLALKETYLRLEQVAKREQMCVHLPSLQLEVPIKVLTDPKIFSAIPRGYQRPMQKVVIYTELTDKRHTTVSFDDVRRAFGYPDATDYMLMPPDLFAAAEFYKNCFPVLIEFRPDKELEKEKIEG